MKLVVFAHKPPPHHGQSYMVELLLTVFGGDARKMGTDKAAFRAPSEIECYHVDCRFSDGVEDIGRIRVGKLFAGLKYCFEALWCRLRFRADVLLYIPAPPMRSAVYRDWFIMMLCRPFFRRRVLYWQAAGLGEWLTSGARAWERWLTRWLLGKPDLSIVLGDYCRSDASAFRSQRTEVVPNAVPDPCPDFEESLLPKWLNRASTRLAMLATADQPREMTAETCVAARFNVLFMSLCTREKGLFDVIEAVAILNQRLERQGAPLRIQLDVAGKFWREAEEREFNRRIEQSDLNGALSVTSDPVVRYHGFVAGTEKRRLLVGSDCFCFPSYYHAESFGLVVVEAMAFGLPVVTTRWRTIPELLPAGYAGLVDPRSPEQIATALEALLRRGYDPALRARFLEHYTERQFANGMRMALSSMSEGGQIQRLN